MHAKAGIQAQRNSCTTKAASPWPTPDHAQERLVGDCLLTSSFLSYTGAFTFNYRHAMVYDMWNKDVNERKIPLTQPCKCVPGF
eukprot:1158274-Pelagomonas_calceolata.AAC.47